MPIIAIGAFQTDSIRRPPDKICPSDRATLARDVDLRQQLDRRSWSELVPIPDVLSNRCRSTSNHKAADQRNQLAHPHPQRSRQESRTRCCSNRSEGQEEARRRGWIVGRPEAKGAADSDSDARQARRDRPAENRRPTGFSGEQLTLNRRRHATRPGCSSKNKRGRGAGMRRVRARFRRGVGCGAGRDGRFKPYGANCWTRVEGS